jgi:hypothetical protein
MPIRFFLAAATAASLFCGLALAQPKPAEGLKQMGEAFVHEPTKSQVLVPKGWEAAPPKEGTFLGIPFLVLRNPKEGVEITVSWSKIGEAEWKKVVEEELVGLQTLYGMEKVKQSPDAVKGGEKGEKEGVRIDVEAGPARDDREVGTVYLFEVAAENKDRYKLKVRGIIPKLRRDKVQPLVDGVLGQLRF